MAGSSIDPIKLRDLCQSENVLPGDVFELQTGVFTGEYDISISGTVEAPVIIRAGDGQNPIIDAAIKITGSNLILDGCLRGVIRNHNWSKRQSGELGSAPTDIPRERSVNIFGENVVLRNWVLHDLVEFGIWSTAISAKIEFNIIYNIGWEGPEGDRGHGHLFYTQNDVGIKEITGNVAFNSFSTGLKIYTYSGMARGYHVSGNTIFNSAVLHGEPDDYGMNYWIQNYDSAPGEYYSFCKNRGYHTKKTGDPVRLGLYTKCYGVHLVNNYFAEGIIKNCEIDEESGNYYGPTPGNAIFVEPNNTIATAGVVTIYNEAGADSATVDLTTVTGLSVGDTVTAWNVQAGVGNDLQTLTLDANKCITVNMQAANRSVAAPIGWTAPATTFPTFGCFVVNKA